MEKLVIIAKEMNEVLGLVDQDNEDLPGIYIEGVYGLDPKIEKEKDGIELKYQHNKKLEGKIEEASEMIYPPSDAKGFSKSTRKWLEEKGWWPEMDDEKEEEPASEPKPKKEKKEQAEKKAPEKKEAKKEKASEPKPKKEKKQDRPLTQLGYIREGIRKGSKHEDIIKGLSVQFDKDQKWAKRRMNEYIKAFGKKGENDKNL